MQNIKYFFQEIKPSKQTKNRFILLDRRKIKLKFVFFIINLNIAYKQTTYKSLQQHEIPKIVRIWS